MTPVQPPVLPAPANWSGTADFEARDPALGLVVGRYAFASPGDVTQVLEIAGKGFAAWSALTVNQRCDLLGDWLSRIEAETPVLAGEMTDEQGKPLAEATAEIGKSLREARQMLGFARGHGGQTLPGRAPGWSNTILRRPRGVVLAITPWNFPVLTPLRKLVPALAAGNAVVLKPSEYTPAAAMRLVRAAEGLLPQGALCLVNGAGEVASGLVAAQVDAISFTGSVATGRKIGAVAGGNLVPVSLELGGKNANLIFADADMDKAVATSVRSAFANQGEICLCASRIYVERSAYDAFLAKYVPAVEALKVGPPSDPETKVGPLASKGHMEKVLSYIDIARKEGGTIAAGGQRVTSLGDGYYVAPTVVTDLPRESRLECEEIFGPVVIVVPFDTEEEAIARANAVHYGLAGVVWTQNLGRAHRVAAAIESGTVWVNTWMTRDTRVPFGGHKHSGIGIEGGPEHSREFFTNTKNICIAME